MAKKLPKPHQRPAIDLGGHGKAWQTVEAQTLEVEDLVIGRGGVQNVIFYEISLRVEFFSGESSLYAKTEQVEAFTRKR